MKRWAMRTLWVGAMMLVGCKPGLPDQATGGKAGASPVMKPADRPTYKDGLLSFCGEVIPLVKGGAAPPYTRGVKLGLSLVEREADSTVSLSISSLDPLRASCLDAAVGSSIAVHLRCDPSPALIWEDFSKREWLSRTERPAEGLVVLRGDPTRRMGNDLHFIAAPSQAYRPGEFPFQGSCDVEPGVERDSTYCTVKYRKGRVGVGYSYLTSSLAPWREVDDLVRTTLEGRPSTAACPYPDAG